MRIMAFSDLHLSARRAEALVDASRAADLVIGAGDFCNARRGLREAMDMLAGIRAPMVLVPGNAESAGELAEVAPPGAVVLHGRGVEVGGLQLFGLGHAVPPTPFGAWSCDLTEAEAAALLAPCHAADILITHSPPHGAADRTAAGQSVGSVAVREAIERIRPRLALCGHVHESWGVTARIGQTEVCNLGPWPNWFDLGPKGRGGEAGETAAGRPVGNGEGETK